MTRFLTLALFLGSTAFAADLADLDELPEAEVVETSASKDIDFADDEDDFAMDLSAPAPVAASQASLQTVQIAAPGPRLPSVDHVEFEDDDFAFDAAAPVNRTPHGATSVEMVELDEDIEASIDEEEEFRAELPEMAGLDDEDLPEEKAEASGTTAGEIKAILSDDDDIELDW